MNIVVNNENAYEQTILSYPDYIYNNSVKNEKFWEESIVDILVKNLRPNSEMLDIGANIGLVTLGVMKKAKEKGISIRRVHCFECMPTTFFLLSENTLPYKDIVYLYPCAVSEKQSLCNISVNEYNQGCNYIYETNDSIHTYDHIKYGEYTENKRMFLPSISLDTISYQFQDISVVKIDVEGFEEHVLRGMTSILKTHRPVIVVEVFEQQPVFEYMKTIGYTQYQLLEDKNVVFYPS